MTRCNVIALLIRRRCLDVHGHQNSRVSGTDFCRGRLPPPKAAQTKRDGGSAVAQRTRPHAPPSRLSLHRLAGSSGGFLRSVFVNTGEEGKLAAAQRSLARSGIWDEAVPGRDRAHSSAGPGAGYGDGISAAGRGVQLELVCPCHTGHGSHKPVEHQTHFSVLTFRNLFPHPALNGNTSLLQLYISQQMKLNKAPHPCLYCS